MKKWLIRIAVKWLKPSLEKWLFERVLYLSDDDIKRLVSDEQYETFARVFYVRLIHIARERYGRFWHEIEQEVRR